METLYDVLKTNQKKRKTFYKGEEYKFFIKNRYIIENDKFFSFLYDDEENIFNILRANIILHSYLNKQAFDGELLSFNKSLNKDIQIDITVLKNAISNKAKNLFYLKDNNQKIYMPFFPRSINEMYVNSPQVILTHPYSLLTNKYFDFLLDPFDTYGYQLYNSYFTKLVFVKESADKKEAAFFHYDTNTIYFINDEGRLDASLVLFDKYLTKIDTSHMLERIKKVINAYFSYDRSKMIDELHENKFISGRLMAKLRKMMEKGDEF